MKVAVTFTVLSAILFSGARPFVQAQASPTATSLPHHVRISEKTAEKLLLHKVELRYPPVVVEPRVTGTVVVAVEIDKNGNVLDPRVISGPLLLQKPVLDVVQKYKYKPYLLHGKAVDVETTVSVVVSLQ